MIVTVEELQKYSGDFNTSILDDTFIGSAQERVEGYLGYKIEEQDYTYSEVGFRGNFVELDAPIIQITSLTLNGVALSEYTVVRDVVNFPSVINGTLEISYSGGYQTIPSSIKEAVLGLAGKKKKTSGTAINASGFNMPDGVSTNYIPNTDTSDFKFLAPISSYRIIRP